MIKCMYFSHFEWLWDWPVLRAELTSFSTDTYSLPPSCSGSGTGSSPAGPLAPGPSWGCRQPISGRPSAEGHVHVHSLALRGPSPRACWPKASLSSWPLGTTAHRMAPGWSQQAGGCARDGSHSDPVTCPELWPIPVTRCYSVVSAPPGRVRRCGP